MATEVETTLWPFTGCSGKLWERFCELRKGIGNDRRSTRDITPFAVAGDTSIDAVGFNGKKYQSVRDRAMPTALSPHDVVMPRPSLTKRVISLKSPTCLLRLAAGGAGFIQTQRRQNANAVRSLAARA